MQHPAGFRFATSRRMLALLLPSCIGAIMLLSSCKKDAGPDIRLLRMQELADSVRMDLQSRVGIPIPGMHFYLQSKNGSYFVSSASANASRISSGHWLRFASVTKMFTSAAILNMAEEGWLNIDDSITALIPGSATPYVPVSVEWNIPYKSKITLRQLMSHTAGVYDADNDIVPSLGKTYTEYMLAINPNHQFATEQYTRYLSSENLSYFQPGTGYHYSNTGYSILSVIISRVYSVRQQANKTFAQYMNDVMIPAVPACVGQIRFPDQATDNRLLPPACNGFIYKSASDTQTVASLNPSVIIGEGNGQGTMKGVHDWLRATYKGNGPLNTQTLQMIYTPLVPDFSNSQYTYGSQAFLDFGRGHTGARGGNLTLMSYDAATDVSVFAYFPFWDITDGGNTISNNGLVPMFTAADLLATTSK